MRIQDKIYYHLYRLLIEACCEKVESKIDTNRDIFIYIFLITSRIAEIASWQRVATL